MLRKILWTMIVGLIILGLIYVFSQGLKRDIQQMPSALLNKPLPDFNLTDVFDEHKHYNRESLVGEYFLINVFASWCPPCAKEHDVIIDLSEQGYTFIGLNYQDNRSEAQIWLDERGNPYKITLFDPEGTVGMDWGVIGVPETFLVDAQGVVRYRHIGILSKAIWTDNFLPLIQKLNPSTARLPYTFTIPQEEERFYNITGKLRCLVCQNQTVLDSNSTLAEDMRDVVYQQIISGKKDDEINQYLTERFGDFILYEPPVNKNTSILWYGPALLLIIAGFVVFMIMKRARKHYKDEHK